MLILHYKRNSGLGCTPEASPQSTEVPVPVLGGVFLWRKRPRARTRVTLSQSLERSPNWRPWVCASELRGWTLGVQASNTHFPHGAGAETPPKSGEGGPHSLNINSHCPKYYLFHTLIAGGIL